MQGAWWSGRGWGYVVVGSQAVIAMRTVSMCSLLNAPWPDRQVAHTRSRICFGTRYQWQRHIIRDGSIWA